MSIGPVSGLSQADLSQLISGRRDRAQSVAAADPQDSVSLSGSSSDSKLHQLLEKLQQLKVSDPAKYEQVTADIADKLKTAASQTSNSSESQFLNNLAQRFQNASHGADLVLPADSASANQAGSYSPGHHHHHHSHSASTGANSGTQDTATAGTSSQTSGSSLQSVFASIFQEVETA